MFIDLSDLSVDQLLEKQLEIKSRIVKAHMTNMAPNIMEQLENFEEQIKIEIVDRQVKQKLKEAQESDDDDVLNIGD